MMPTFLLALLAIVMSFPLHAGTIRDDSTKKNLKILDTITLREITGAAPNDWSVVKRLLAIREWQPRGNPWLGYLTGARNSSAARFQVMLMEENSSMTADLARDYLAMEHLLPGVKDEATAFAALVKRKIEVAPIVAAYERVLESSIRSQPIADKDMDAIEFVVPVAPIVMFRQLGGKQWAMTGGRAPARYPCPRGSECGAENLRRVLLAEYAGAGKFASKFGTLQLGTGIHFQGFAVPNLQDLPGAAERMTCRMSDTDIYTLAPMPVIGTDIRFACETAASSETTGRFWLGVVGHLSNARVTDGIVELNTKRAVMLDMAERRIVLNIPVPTPAALGDTLDYSKDYLPAIYRGGR